MALIQYRKVWKALKECAPGIEDQWTDHHVRFFYEGREGSLPNGGHGPHEVKEFQVRRLSLLLGIYECMRREIASLH